MEQHDCAAVTEIFHSELPSSLPACLGASFLERIYLPHLLESKASFGLVCLDQDRVVGFIFGGQASGFFGAVQHRPSAFFRAYTKALRQGKLSLAKHLDILGVTFLMRACPPPQDSAELLYMAVSNSHQRHGVGSRLMQPFFEELARLGYDVCLVQTMQSTPAARHFYRKHDFTEYCETSNRVFLNRRLARNGTTSVG